MSDYRAPIRDMQFVVKELVGLEQVSALPGLEEATSDVVDAIMEEAAKFATGVLSPLNRVGDMEGARLENGVVSTPPGFKEAYHQFIHSGWNGLTCDPGYGGQGLPLLVGTPVLEMWHAANMGFALCPLLNQAAIEAIGLRGSAELKQRFLPKMVSGLWTGTMNLTEPQAGSDLAALRTRAVPEGDRYRIFGQKIFITYGEHDYTENIIHLVLARIQGAPEGVKGISLFVVPKYLVNADGSIGERNDVRCVSIEHKLGIHASPTAVLAYGDHGGAIAYLVGEENRGLEYMFIMMNLARFAVGVEGVAIAERAYQRAVAYARERIQGVPVGVRGGTRMAIIHHPDVRRMLMSMKSQVEAARALAYDTASLLDRAVRHPDRDEKARNQALADLLIPIVKAWSTEIAIDVASTAIQVHGGMGYIEETGAAQHLRDARIATIYEGTTGIQSNDLLGRKILRDQGATMEALLTEMAKVPAELRSGGEYGAIASALKDGLDALREATRWVVRTAPENPRHAFAGAFPYLKLAGTVVGGWEMTRAAGIAQRKLADRTGDGGFYKAKLATARFYADHVLSQAQGLRHAITQGAAGVLELAEEQF